MRSKSLLVGALLLAVAASAGDGLSRSQTGTARHTLVEVGRVLGPSDVGVLPGETTGTADVSAIALPDGRIRI